MNLSARVPSRPGFCAALAFAVAVPILFATLVFSPAARANPPDGAWVQYESISPIVVPPSRSAFPMVLDAARQRMLVFGGIGMNDVWEFSFLFGTWAQLNPVGVPPSPRNSSAAIYDAPNDRMIVFGGYGSNGSTTTQLNEVWALSLSGTPAWTQILPSGTLPVGRQDMSAVYDPSGQRMIVVGGFRAGNTYTNQVWSLSLSGSPSWTQLTPAGTPPSPRAMVGCAYDASRHRAVIHGGWNGTSYLRDTWALDLSGSGTWSQVVTGTLGPARRQSYVDYDAANDRFVLFGGYDGARRNDVWMLNFSGTPDWTSVGSLPASPTSRYAGGAVYDAPRSRFVIYGGQDGVPRSDVQALSLSGSPAWTMLLNDQNLATVVPRHSYALAFDPATSDLYMFGGTTTSNNIDTNALHFLSLASSPPRWRPLVASTPPSARHGHQAVWDPIRHRMLMFGGWDNARRNDLWAMNPYPTPSWQQLTTFGIRPEARTLFGMVFDPAHDRIVIAGGESQTHYACDDIWELPLSGPNALTWSPVTTSGASPLPRWINDMVYDPLRHRAVMFSGAGTGELRTDVWALELDGPAAWTPLPAGGAPTGRSQQSMVYDPVSDRMVVFGGWDGAARNDVWSFMFSPWPQWVEMHPSGGPPAGRYAIHAVYDPLGARLVTYGGLDGAIIASDTWALELEPFVVPTTASLVESHAEPGLVQLAWFVPDAASAIASVERREGAGAWTSLGTPERSASDRLSFEDRGVIAGARYAYRLKLRASGEETITDAVEIEVPSGYTLELAGAQPNPAIGERLTVAFALSKKGTARLELLDLTGRRIAERDVSAFGPGRHRVELGEGVRLAPGVYVVRLEAEQRSLAKKAFVIR